ncbi:MAG: hypothetical protein AMXMBFR7_15640 [Planctomycetota bacterium]
MFRFRVHVLSALLIAAFGLVLGRLAQLQLVRHEVYLAARAHQTRPQVEARAPKRGSILDRDGRVLAADVPSFDLAVRADKLPFERVTLNEIRAARRQARTPDELARAFAALEARLAGEGWTRALAARIGRAPEELAQGLLRALDRVARGWERATTPVPFASGIDAAVWNALRAAQEDAFFAQAAQGVPAAASLTAPVREAAPGPYFAGLTCLTSVRRAYPHGTFLAHVLGTLGELHPDQLEQLRARGVLVDRLEDRERIWSETLGAWPVEHRRQAAALLGADPATLSVPALLSVLRGLDDAGRRAARALGLGDALRWSDAPPRVALGEAERFWLGEDLTQSLRRTAPAALPDTRIGESGVEAWHNQLLRGESGLSFRLDGLEEAQRALHRDIAARQGANVRLTISSAWQRAAEEALASQGHPGAVVVLDCRSGEVLALASGPAFDPNLFAPPREGAPRQAALKALLEDARLPLLNRAASGQYPLGSVMKALVAAAALELGQLDPHAGLSCPGHVDEGGRRFHCDGRRPHGLVDLDQALRRSCNVYFYRLGAKVGAEALGRFAYAAGLGRRTELDLPGEAGGAYPDSVWRARHLPGQSWSRGKDFLTAIGQGYVSATPLQAAALMACLANGGRPVTPRLWADAPAEAPAAPVFSAQTAALVRRGLDEAVNVGTPGAMGTAYKAFHQGVAPLPVRVAGKTGTADVTDEQPPHAWFAGYAPAHAPQVAFCVFVEHGGHGGDVAAPLAYRMLRAVYGGGR